MQSIGLADCRRRRRLELTLELLGTALLTAFLTKQQPAQQQQSTTTTQALTIVFF